MTNDATPAKNGSEWDPLPVLPAGSAEKQEHIFTKKERALLLVSAALAFVADRAYAMTYNRGGSDGFFFSAIFWLVFLAAFYMFFWERLKRNKPLWLAGGLTAALCVWNFIFDYGSEYGEVTSLVIPAVIMAHAQLFASGRRLKEAGEIAVSWLLGWLVKPFIAIPMMIGAAGTFVTGGKKAVIKKVLAGFVVTVPLLLVIVPLLGSADAIFGYYLEAMLKQFNIFSAIGHTIIVVIAAALIYSLLWEAGFSERKAIHIPKLESKIDFTISVMVLGAVSFVYILFCAVQFTYLFARAGLPVDMTYSQYAREGFAQIIMICSMNLLLFGIFLAYGPKRKSINVLLALVLALTAVMLVSSFVRLGLYIDVYRLTWLRLLSAWFIIYMAAVLVLCAVRMLRESLPLIAVSAFVLLGWYAVLGYMNPDALIIRYNLSHNGYSSEWISNNKIFIRNLSDNGMLILMDSCGDAELLDSIVETRGSEGLSVSSYMYRNKIAGLNNESPDNGAEEDAPAPEVEIRDTGSSMSAAIQEIHGYTRQ